MKRPSHDLWGKLRPLAREMRHEPTRPEELLWAELQHRQLSGLKFRRQHAVDRFIVDFYCAERHLAIELDGSSHDRRAEEDDLRQAYLASLGLSVLRFSNEDVQTNMRQVLAQISAATAELGT